MTDHISQQQGRLLLEMARSRIAQKLGVKAGDNTADPCQGNREGGGHPVDKRFLDEKRGLFVTLHIDGALRGCIGNIEPVRKLGEAIGENALAAAFRDSRFSPLTRGEFDQIDIEISLLSRPQPLDYRDGQALVQKLALKKEGVILEKGGLRATFLPQVWEQLPDPEDFLAQLCMKAGLGADAWKNEVLVISTYGVQSFGELP